MLEGSDSETTFIQYFVPDGTCKLSQLFSKIMSSMKAGGHWNTVVITVIALLHYKGSFETVQSKIHVLSPNNEMAKHYLK